MKSNYKRNTEMSLKIFTKRFSLLFCTNAGIFFFYSNITEHKVPFQNLQEKAFK